MTLPAFPDFYMVGAPKCGTSALYEFLAQHPAIFLPAKKELLFFGSDLSYPSRLSEAEFLEHFVRRGAEERAGTAHTAYLQSRRAAEEIQSRSTHADIIIMLRDPVEMLPSWHSELLYETIEDIQDFEAALDAEPERRRGLRIPSHARQSYVESLYYTDVASYADQVERYLDAFGRSHVHVILHEDLRADPRTTYRATLEFLGVDPDFAPEFAVVNPNKVVRSRTLQYAFFATSAPWHRVIRRAVPGAVRQSLLRMNVRVVPRPELTESNRVKLRSRFAEDVRRLENLLDRDLSKWLTGPQ
jgi:sulfotransferase family protein